MKEEKKAELEHDFILALEKFTYIQELKKRIEVGNLELNLSVIQKELQRLYQLNPDDMTTKYKLIWFDKYFKGNKGLDRLRTVNNLIMRDVHGEERLNRAKSQETIIDFLITNNIKTIEELKELNQIESLTPIEHEKMLLNKFEQLNIMLPKQLETKLSSDNQRGTLFDLLSETKFIDADKDSFIYIFGGKKPHPFKPIHWNFGANALFELLELITDKVSNENLRRCGAGLFDNIKNISRPNKQDREYSIHIEKIEAIIRDLNLPTNPTT